MEWVRYNINHTYSYEVESSESGGFANIPTTFLFDRGYTGHEHLDRFGLINMNGRVGACPERQSRFGNPYVDRFLSPDPFIQSPTNAQNYNRYSYALNNPLKYTDPSEYLFRGQDMGFNPGGFVNNGFRVPGNGTAGSGNHWSDGYRSEYGNYLLMNSQTFNATYGSDASKIGWGIWAGDSPRFEQWRNGETTINMVREQQNETQNNQGKYIGSAYYSKTESGKYIYFGFADAAGNQLMFNPVLINSQGIVGEILVGDDEGSAGGGMGDVNFEGYAMSLSAAGLQQFMKMNGKELQNLQKTLEANNGVSSININNKILNNTKWVKRAGVIGNVANGFNVAFDIYQNGGNVSASQMVDGVAAVVAFVPGYGWMMSSAISLTKDYTITMNQLSQKGISDFYLYSGFAGPRW